jgi:2-oxoglutarate dehydrogenase E2 component (dihydrolipoamide succinyltransferase)
MAAFFRGLLLFLFGAIAGAAGILFLTPSFQVDIRRGDTAIKPLDLGTRVAQPTPAPVVPTPAPPKATAPAPAVAVKPAAPAAPAAPTTPATAEPALDFAAISRHLILWPTAVTVKAPTTVVVNVEGQKPQDLPLEAGAVLQLTRVLPTGQLEVRAKGAKFEIKSSSTDFAVELGKRVSELVAKGTKFDSPYPTASATAAAPESPAPAATTVASAPPVVAAPKRPLTLAERIDVLYGRKAPEPVAPSAAPVVPVSPAPAANTPATSPAPAPAPAADAPAPAVTPAPATREAAKVEEKGKDLDRKMNQLFK